MVTNLQTKNDLCDTQTKKERQLNIGLWQKWGQHSNNELLQFYPAAVPA